MASWAKIKFLYDTLLGTADSFPTASSTATGNYSPAYVANMLEGDGWKAFNATSPAWIKYTFTAGINHQADCLAIIGHNLGTLGAQIDLQYSTDGVNFTSALTFTPASDKAIYREFTSPGPYPCWRLLISKTGGFAGAPFISTALFGLKTELDYATASFDPYEQNVKASVNLSQGGYVTGVHTQYTERNLSLSFEGADATLYNKVKSWWETNGLKNFFVVWESANNPSDVFLMRSDAKFSNPLDANTGGLYRNITINLTGRKE